MYKIFSVLLVGMFFLATSVVAEARTVIYDQNTGRKLCEGVRECRQYERTARRAQYQEVESNPTSVQGSLCAKKEYYSVARHKCLEPTETKFLYLDPVTGFMEVDIAKCGRPGFWATLIQGVIKAVIQGYSVDALGYQGGYAVSGVANGFVDIVAQNRLGKKCNIPAQLADRNNFTDGVQRELVREMYLLQQHQGTLYAQVAAEEVAKKGGQPQMVQAPQQIQPQQLVAQQQTSFAGSEEVLKNCATNLKRDFEVFGGMDAGAILTDMERRCREKGQLGFGVLPDNQSCGCGGV